MLSGAWFGQVALMILLTRCKLDGAGCLSTEYKQAGRQAGRRGILSRADLLAHSRQARCLTCCERSDGGDVVVVVGVCQLLNVCKYAKQGIQHVDDSRHGLEHKGTGVDGKTLRCRQQSGGENRSGSRSVRREDMACFELWGGCGGAAASEKGSDLNKGGVHRDVGSREDSIHVRVHTPAHSPFVQI